jgi:hypothetical protein
LYWTLSLGNSRQTTLLAQISKRRAGMDLVLEPLEDQALALQLEATTPARWSRDTFLQTLLRCKVCHSLSFEHGAFALWIHVTASCPVHYMHMHVLCGVP